MATTQRTRRNFVDEAETDDYAPVDAGLNMSGGESGGDLDSIFGGFNPNEFDRKPLPPGQYVCRLSKVEQTTAKSGAPRLQWIFEIAEGPFARRQIWDGVNIQPNTKGLIVRNAQATAGPAWDAFMEECKARVASGGTVGGTELINWIKQNCPGGEALVTVAAPTQPGSTFNSVTKIQAVPTTYQRAA